MIWKKIALAQGKYRMHCLHKYHQLLGKANKVEFKYQSQLIIYLLLALHRTNIYSFI